MNQDSLFRALTTHAISSKIRLGNRGDGGYVIADNIGDYQCYISAGIGDDASFCADFIKKYHPLEKVAFDGTLQGLPKNFPKEIRFVKKNIGTSETPSTTNLRDTCSA
jgi:hypothetical protein